MRRIFALTIFLVLLYSIPAGACTSVAVRDTPNSVAFVGKSYDWGSQAAMVVANMTGITKRALVFPSDDPTIPQNPVTWTSKNYSITFNQYGREITNAGMNEYGLVVETMEMEPGGSQDKGADYKPAGATQVINWTQWVQYILDNFASVDDFLSAPPEFDIMGQPVYAHFLICDPSQCVVVEIINNGLVITKGDDLGVQPQGGDFIPVYALANDYYSCSAHGMNGDPTLSLEDYIGFGGSRPIPYGTFNYADDPKSSGYCLDLPPGRGCDSACRSLHNAWYNSNSVERFVRAAAGSRALSGNNVTVDDMFRLLNDVVSQDTVTGGTVWQIVYDLKNLEIHWRTIADGSDNQYHMGSDGRMVRSYQFTGAPRTLKFTDVMFGDCSTHNDTVVNIDDAPACSSLSDPDPLCNPNPQLPSCNPNQSSCTMTDYDQTYNVNLVTFSSNHTEVKMDNFIDLVKKSFNGITDDQAQQIMDNIWGGYPGVWGGSYPIGFTACHSDVTPEGIVNLYLESARDPYINPMVKNRLGNLSLTREVSYSRKFTITDTLKLDASAGITGQDKTTLDSLTVANGILTVKGHIPSLEAKASAKASFIDEILGTISFPNTAYASFPVDDFTVNVSGASVSYDETRPICFTNPTVTTSYVLGNISCHVDSPVLPGWVDTLFKELGFDLESWICDSVYNDTSSIIDPLVTSALDSVGTGIVGSAGLPLCSDTTVAAPAPPPTLTAGWGGLEGQYVTARAGHTYALDGIVTADKNSFSYEFATFSESAPGSSDLMPFNTVRMRSMEGGNGVSTLWKPTSEGERDLFFRVSRWDEDPEEATPAVLRVHVLPPEGPTAWLGLTNEGLSTKLKEIK